MSTPLLKQYHEIKERYPGAVLFFRMGDFFEMFYEDAKLSADVLGLTLTKRGHGRDGEVPLAGFPHHQLESYLAKMTRAGYRVAVCEQLEDPRHARGLVKRGVTEVVSAGTTFSETALDEARNNYLVAVIIQDDRAGLSYADVTTGEFFTGVLPVSEAGARLQALEPSELLCVAEQKMNVESLLGRLSPAVTVLPRWHFTTEAASRTLTEHFGVSTLRGFGLAGMDLAVGAAGALVHYLHGSLVERPPVLPDLQVFSTSQELVLDAATRRHLELTESAAGDSRATLFFVINRTRTAPGARLLRRWLLSPLCNLEAILERQSRVAYLYERPSLVNALSDWLGGTGDLQRLLSKLSTARGSPRDAVAIRTVLEKLPRLKEMLQEHKTSVLAPMIDALEPQRELVEFLRSVITDEPPLNVGDGRTVREGFSSDLDELRNVRSTATRWIHEYQATERARTGIPSLKVGYNKVFGYYIEISNAHKERVPAEYSRKQTLTNAERYLTPELKVWEEKILSADERVSELETEIWEKAKAEIISRAESISKVARALAELDACLSLARVARERHYCQPELTQSRELLIVGGRHPVVESLVSGSTGFVANDLHVGTDEFQIMILTGPNMAGKSTYLRQAAHIVVLAQMGSFVPATEARVGIVDRIFTRIGAGDNLAAGESTFLVEMTEVANILRYATANSLVILDEVGRGTSTYDGLSLAWAITEFLHDKPGGSPKTLFATHYHELNSLAQTCDRIRNYRVEVEEWGDRVVFLHRISPGETDRSYGIEVARLAGLPPSVVERAKSLLPRWEKQVATDSRIIPPPSSAPQIQLTLFETSTQRVMDALHSLDLEQLSPRDALNKLYEIKDLALGNPMAKIQKTP